MLRFAEEIMLLMLDDDGKFVSVPDRLLRYGLAGGVLMDLALENRIDTDVDKLVLVDSTPVDDNLLDPLLADIAASSETHGARYWIEHAVDQADDIRETAIDRLVERGILNREEGQFLWVFRSRRYPTIDGTAEREVKLRIMEVLFSEKIPSPRDVVIINLAHACNLFKEILSARELAQAAERIDQVRKLDLIGQAMSRAISDIELSLTLAVERGYYI
ncbi:MAG: GPP34 family phosphoprotein [Gemmatimonadetes bacterium]|nr:GPP34 family phosphoprotein [Gemmatimonadota bacterium]